MYTKLGILTEASKLKILTDKEGLDEDQAKLLDELCGGLSLWMLGKIKGWQTDILKSWDNKKEFTNSEIIDKINKNGLTSRVRQEIVGIMDWVRVGLDGNVKPYKDLTFAELNLKSKEWHDSLNIGEADINYVEKNDIIKDFRDENGNGFYWADLNTKDSKEESKRMGHCGESKYGYIYSLRETRQLNDKYKINQSHLTTAIGHDGIMYQLKGPKNSKPKEEYHSYILPLFYVLGGEGEEDDYLVKGFGTEYASQQDFKLSDLPDDVIRDLYQNRPELFSGRSMQKKLMDMGIIEKPNIDYNITLKLDPDDVGGYVDGDYVYRRYKKKVTSPAGNEYDKTVEVTMFELILAGDTWDLYYNDDPNWKSALHYEVDKENETLIRNILRKLAERDNEEYIPEDFDKEDTESLIDKYDDDYHVQHAIGHAVSNSESSSYADYLYKELESALEEYGTVEQMNDEGVILHIDTTRYFDELSEDYYDEYMERCDDDIKCAFDEMVGSGDVDKPKWGPDERWYPDINRADFNEDLSWRLSEAEAEYGIK
jgi:hypothetical protein